jgi:hypothetical protein
MTPPDQRGRTGASAPNRARSAAKVRRLRRP